MRTAARYPSDDSDFPGNGSRTEYHALLFDFASGDVPVGSTLAKNAEWATSVLRPDAGETSLPSDERFAVRFLLAADITRDELRALFAYLRDSLTEERLESLFAAWEAEGAGAAAE